MACKTAHLALNGCLRLLAEECRAQKYSRMSIQIGT